VSPDARVCKFFISNPPQEEGGQSLRANHEVVLSHMPKAPAQCIRISIHQCTFLLCPSLPRIESLLNCHSGTARQLLRWLLRRSYRRLVGHNDIVELVLGNGSDSVGVCEKSDIEAYMCNCVRTYANHERADGGAGDCVLDQVRRTSSQQSRRGPHAVVIVGRTEGFAGLVSDPLPSMHTARLTIPCWLVEALTVLRGKSD
jgi:hypothetical protein